MPMSKYKCQLRYVKTNLMVYLSLWCTKTSVWLLVTELFSPLLRDWNPCWDLGCLEDKCWELFSLTTSGALVKEDWLFWWWSFENVSIDRLRLRLAIKAFFSACVVGVRLCCNMISLSGGKSWDCASGKGWYFPVLPSSICKPYRWYDTLLKLLLNKKSLLFPLFVFCTDLLSVVGEHPLLLLVSWFKRYHPDISNFKLYYNFMFKTFSMSEIYYQY